MIAWRGDEMMITDSQFIRGFLDQSKTPPSIENQEGWDAPRGVINGVGFGTIIWLLLAGAVLVRILWSQPF